MTEWVTPFERMFRRVMMMIGRGRLTAVNDSGAVQLVQIRLGTDEVRDNTPRVLDYGISSSAPPGSDAVVLFVGGDRSNGAVIGTNHQGSRPRNLKVGEVIIYDDQGQIIHITRTGIVITAPGKKVRIEGKDIDLHATNSWSWDVDGYGQRITSQGGGAYQIQTWQQGATVTSVTGPINPPEGP